MNRLTVVAATVLLAIAGPALSADKKQEAAEKQRREDIADHRAMAQAHMNAAACMEGGKSEKECHAQLEKDCKGIGIGKTCGMKHRHKH